jgi:pyruvate kinase
MEAGFIEGGDLVVITAGIPVGLSGTTNLIKVHTIGKVLLTGIGIGNRVGTGRVVVGNSEEELLSKFEDGDVLVCRATYRDMVKFMERASAIIAEEGGLTSHCAIVGLNLNKPTVVGAANATQILHEGDIVTVDGITGQVYKGEAKVL